LGNAQATPEAVNLPVYEPSAATTPVTGTTASAVVPTTVTTTTAESVAPVAQSAEATEAEATTATEESTATEPVSDEATATPAEAEATPAVATAEATEAEAPTATATALPTEAAAAPATVLAGYTAEIASDDEVVVVAEVSGQILELLVEVGDHIQAGDVLARLDRSALEAQQAQALAGVRAAKAQLDRLKAPADKEDLDAARAAVAADSATYNRAVSGLTAEEQRAAVAQLQQAQAAVNVAQAGYNLVRAVPEIGMLPQSMQLQQATLALEAAQAQYDKIVQGATQDQIAGAYAQLANAQAGLKRLEEGAKAAQIRAAEAQVRTAENALYLAQLQLKKSTVVAAMDGIVAQLQTATGAMAAPGAPLLTLISPTVKVTIDVEETQLGQLQVGQKANIRVVAYPEQVFAGVVSIISPALNATTRTVQVTIRPDDDEGLLRPGMSAQVELFASE